MSLKNFHQPDTTLSGSAANHAMPGTATSPFPAGIVSSLSQLFSNATRKSGRLAARPGFRTWRDRFAAWCRSVSGDIEFSMHERCVECERPCARVNPDIATAEECTGRRQIADCTVCVERVEFPRGRGCPVNTKHLLANVKPKPRLAVAGNSEEPVT